MTIENDDGRSRKDCELIFRLLWDRGVRKIIRVVVEEQEDYQHTDEMIISLNLEKLDIEEWDWKIKDLCSETIRRAAPNAKTLFLYSSGNNAVLRSWSGDGGLNNFAKVLAMDIVQFLCLKGFLLTIILCVFICEDIVRESSSQHHPGIGASPYVTFGSCLRPPAKDANIQGIIEKRLNEEVAGY